MAITFDPRKHEKTFEERGLDFREAEMVFAGRTIDVEDTRRDYGECRVITIGHLRGRMVMVLWTQRGADRHVFSMRKTNEREQKKYGERLRQSRRV